MQLLVVEDDPDLQETLGWLLSEEGYLAVTVASLADAYAAIDRMAFQLIITDLFDANVPQALEQIQALRQHAFPTPIGILTARHITADLAVPDIAFVEHKPFNLEDLLGHIAMHCQHVLPDADVHDAATIQRYFAALSDHNWEELLTLCTDDVTYTLPGATLLTATVTGKAAFATFAHDTFAHFPQARFENVAVYGQPKGLAARYTATWFPSEGQTATGSGAVVFRFEEGRICQIGVHLSTEEATFLEQHYQSPKGSHPGTKPPDRAITPPKP